MCVYYESIVVSKESLKKEIKEEKKVSKEKKYTKKEKRDTF
jgi:hypothetical protein